MSVGGRSGAAYESSSCLGAFSTDIGRQDFHDRAVIFLGIFGQPFQGIDPAQPDCHFVTSQLLNCFGKPFGDVALFRNPDIVLSCLNPTLSQIQPHKEPASGQNLGEGSAVLIFKACEAVRIYGLV